MSGFWRLVGWAVLVFALAGCSQLLGQNDDEILLIQELFPNTSSLEIPDTERELHIREKTSFVSAFFRYEFTPAGGGSTISSIAEQAAAAVTANGWELVETEQGRRWCGRSAHPEADEIVHSVSVDVVDNSFVEVMLAESLPGACNVPLSGSPS